MRREETTQSVAEPLAGVVEREAGQNAFLCYQCARCTSGCPVADHMDLTPSQLMRAIQLDDRAALESKSVWLCASCQTCTARCPQNLDIAAIMDALRIESLRAGLTPAIPDVEVFSRLFLKNVDLFGRVYEIGLMAALNAATRRPFANASLGLEMLKRGRLKLLPEIAKPPRTAPKVEQDANTVAYYPGCSLHSTASEYDKTIHHVAGALGLKLVEPPGWTCCGSTPAHTRDHQLATALPLRNLAAIEQMGLDVVTAPCSACYARTRNAEQTVRPGDPAAIEVEKQTGHRYRASVRVQHLIETLLERGGTDRIAHAAIRPLTGLKVACYYGCLITRPPKVTGAGHPEYPMQMEEVLRALGAEPIDWSYKTDCCGATLGLTQTGLAVAMSRKILENARACGADVVAAACPMCHVNLDARQPQMNLGFDIPVLYVTQLMAWAFGFNAKESRLDKNIVDPRPALAR
jgi:heterodisulfide reductase subunit B2